MNMSNYSQNKTIVFVKTFSYGGLNEVVEGLIQWFTTRKKWRVKVLIVDYSNCGIPVPTTKHTFTKIAGCFNLFVQFLSQLFSFLFINNKKIVRHIENLHPDIIIWSHDSLLHIPTIPSLTEHKQVFLFEEWMREKYEFPPVSLKGVKNLKRTIWNIIRDVFVSKNIKYLANADLVVFHTQAMLEKAKMSGYFVQRDVIIPLGIDTGKYKPLIRRVVNKRTKSRILFIGPLADFKGVHLLINSLIQLHKEKDLSLWVISYSKGRDFEWVKKKLKNLEIEFDFYEGIYEEEKIRLLNKADVLVHVPRQEPYGLTILEALSCGTKVVTTKGSGVLEFIKKKQRGLYVLRNYFVSDLVSLIKEALRDNVNRKEIRKDFLKQGINNENFYKKFYQQITE